jgi:hypothetical protein
MKKIYIAGPMTGLPEFNYPAFFEAEKKIEALGFKVTNPARNDEDTSKPFAYYIKIAIKQVLQNDAIAFLPGWRQSRGANIEKTVGEALGLKFYEYRDGKLFKFQEETVCQEADRLVSHDRQDSYGHPFHDFSRTAKIWGAILDMEVTARQVGLCMMGVKISRHCNSSRRDNMTDAAGYAKCVHMVDTYKPIRA